MTGPLRQPWPASARAAEPLHASPEYGIAVRHGPLLATALGALCFLPYPAVPVGNNAGIQSGNVITILACLPLLLLPWRRRVGLWIFPLILVPLCASAIKVTLTDDRHLAVSLKSVYVWGLSCLTIVAAQLYAPRYALRMLTGIALVTLLHVAVGLWQIRGFSTGDLPLYRLYVNPSFLSVQANADTIARYVRRPFGLFPEPSAMSSSLAPWVLFWIAHTCGVVRLWQEPKRWQRVLFAAAGIGGLFLIIASQSGHAIATLAALLPIALLWFVSCRATLRTYLVLVAVFGVVLPLVLLFAAASIGDRLGGKSDMGNSSWGERSDSLRIGFWLLARGDVPTGLFGIGPGLTAVAIQDATGLEAVWSVLLTYVYDTGALGLVALGCIAYHVLRVWRCMRFDLVFVAIAVVWLVGVTLTTSYEQLLPPWLTLACLTVWPAICRPREARVAEPEEPRQPMPPRRPLPRRTVAAITSPTRPITLGATGRPA
jgi:hypothetical protein